MKGKIKMEVKRKLWVKALSCFLAALMVFQILPLTVFANDFQNKNIMSSEVSSDINYDEINIVEEIIEERDANSKTYLLEDGTYCTLTSSQAIHTKADDSWNEIIASDNVPDNVTDASAQMSLLLNELSANNETENTNLNDGLVINDTNSNLTIYGAELYEDENEDLQWNITQGYGTISEYSSVLVKPVVTNNLSYDKTHVTVDASIKLTCNTENSDISYATYIQAFNSGWSNSNFSTEDLLEIDDDFNFVNVSEQIYDYNTIDDAGNYVWNITSIFNKWENGTIENNGLIIRTAGTDNVYITNGILIRYYRIIDENDSGFSYQSEPMGRAGTLYINNYTNVPTLVRNELSIDGILMPVSLTRSINVGCNNYSFGAGGRWNYSSNLTYSSDTFIWNTLDGTSKRFHRSSDNETDDQGREKWVEYLYNGGECVLWVSPSSIRNLPYNFSNNIIVDEENNTYSFNSSNQVVSISNSGCSIDINYDTSGKIINITDGVGRTYVFDNSGFTAPYNNVKNVSIKSVDGAYIKYDGKTNLDIDYSYEVINGVLCLSSATYADGKVVNYEYDSFGRLLNIINIDNSKISLEYYNSDAQLNSNPAYFSRLKSYTKSVYDNTSESYITQYKVEFDSDSTYRRSVKTTSNGKVKTEVSQYNTNLDLLYVCSSNGNEYYADYDDSHKLLSYTTCDSNATNLVLNGDMSQKKLGGGPKYWNMINLNSNNCKLVTRGDNYSTEFSNSIEQTRGLYQDITIDGHSGDKYVVSAWGKATSTIPKDSRFWGIRILALNNEGLKETIHEMQFDTSLWDIEQIRKTAFSLPFDTTKITIQLLSCNQLFSVQFDDIELYKTEDCYVATVDDKNSNNNCICSFCTEPNCPCKCQSEETCECKYCKRGTITTKNKYGSILTEIITDADTSMKKSYEYSSTDNYLAVSTDENGVATYYLYDENTGTLTSMAAGNETDTIDYTYNAVGLLKTVSQTVTNIVTGEKVNMISEYTYDGDNLTQINHNGSVYSFEYDMYGNITNVMIGTQSLAEYSYNSSNQLGYLLYGNGDRINYTYDDNGNITSISTQRHDEEADSIIEYEYTYNDNGKLSSYTDNVNGTVTTYTDDGYTIVIPSADENSEDIIIYSTATTDDANESSINLFGYEFNTKKYADTYDIETAQTTASSKYTLPCEALGITGIGDSITITDYYGRDISSTFKLHTDDFPVSDDGEDLNRYDYIINNSYTYVTDNNNVTTNLVESYKSEIKLQYNLTDEEKAELDAAIENGEVSQEEADEKLNKTLISLTTSYEYDNAGRITKIYRNDEILALYKYDEAGQLTEEINFELEFICHYTYNEGGNITSKVYYADAEYDEENDEIIYGEPTDIVNYSYESNTQWGDLLTDYNGVGIEYDEIGNPLNYQGLTYAKETVDLKLEWDGRLLKTVIYPENDNGNTVQKYEYSYNADGLRTRKDRYLWDSNISDYQLYQTVEYVWDGNVLKGYRITYQTIDNDNTRISPNYIVLPLYDEKQEIIGVAAKAIDENTDGETSNEIAENVYYFIKDAQGNIIAMFNPLNNDQSVVYSYTGYGSTALSIPGEEEKINRMPTGTFLEQLAKALAGIGLAVLYSVYKEINPFMYRGYMYDGETGLYYNQSRYYSGEWGRFINADETLDTGSGTPLATNVFAYCENDPINYTDENGLASKTKSISIHKKILKGSDLTASLSASISWSAKGAGITLKGTINIYLSKSDSNVYTSCATMAGTAAAAAVSVALIGSTSGIAAAVVPLAAGAVGGIVTTLFYEYVRKDSNGRIRIKRSITVKRGIGRY